MHTEKTLHGASEIPAKSRLSFRKKRTLIKACHRSSFRRLGCSAGRAENTAERFPLRKRGSSHRANFSRSRRERRTNFIARQKSTEAIAPALSHYNTSDAVLSSKYERMFVFHPLIKEKTSFHAVLLSFRRGNIYIKSCHIPLNMWSLAKQPFCNNPAF